MTPTRLAPAAVSYIEPFPVPEIFTTDLAAIHVFEGFVRLTFTAPEKNEDGLCNIARLHLVMPSEALAKSAEAPECTDAIAKLAAHNGFPYGSKKVFASLAGPAEMYWVTNVLAYCYGMEHFTGDPAPVTVSNICSKVYLALITAKYREPDRPLGPSFNCKKANTPIEMLLCRDSELMHLDALMGQLYKMLRQREGGGNSPLLTAQRAWIIERDKKCDVSAYVVSSYESSRTAARCVSEMTMARLTELLEANGTPLLDLSPLIEKSSAIDRTAQ